MDRECPAGQERTLLIPPSPPRTEACPGAWSQPERGIPHSSQRCEGREAGLGLSLPYTPSGRAVKSELFPSSLPRPGGEAPSRLALASLPSNPPLGHQQAARAQEGWPSLPSGAGFSRVPASGGSRLFLADAPKQQAFSEVQARLVPHCSQLLALAGRDSRTQHAPITGVTRAAATSPLLHGARRPLTREEGAGRPWPQRSAALPPPSRSGGVAPHGEGPRGGREWPGRTDLMGLTCPLYPVLREV